MRLFPMSVPARLAIAFASVFLTVGAGSAQAQSPEAAPSAIRSAPPGTAARNVVTFSPDGSRIAAVNTANEITIRGATTGRLVTTLPGQDGYMSTLDWSPDRSLLASGSNDGTIQIWDVAAETIRRTLTGWSAGGPFRAGKKARETP